MADGSKGIPVIVVGLGRIGQAIARAALEQPDLRVVAAVDPSFSGQTLEQVLGSVAPPIEISSDEGAALQLAAGGVSLYSAASTFDGALPHLERAVRAGVSVVSTCEELAYPWLRNEERADTLDLLCESNEVAVVSVGANPGFVFDRLPAFLSQVTGPVRHIQALHVDDPARDSTVLRCPMGSGTTEEDFHAAAERGDVGHLGLSESAMLAALGCGFEIDEVEEEILPLVAEEDSDAPRPIRSGEVVGFQQIARGFTEGTERVRLELFIQIGAESPRDEVALDARPPLRVTMDGGLPGDEATAWAVVNAAPAVTMLRGLVTVLDLPTGR